MGVEIRIRQDELLSNFLADSLERAREVNEPFRHWLLDDVLPPATAHAVADLPFEAPRIGDTLGKRETHNATRRFFSPDVRRDYLVCEEIAEAFQRPATVHLLERKTGATLAGSYLRIEYCQDTAGFWLEPHTDIGAKRFTMLIYLSDCPEAEGWGTDLFDADGKHLGAAPGGFDKGLIFVPGKDTWHGVQPRQFTGVRKSLIVNYVIPEWRSRQELAFPDKPVTTEVKPEN